MTRGGPSSRHHTNGTMDGITGCHQHICYTAHWQFVQNAQPSGQLHLKIHSLNANTHELYVTCGHIHQITKQDRNNNFLSCCHYESNTQFITKSNKSQSSLKCKTKNGNNAIQRNIRTYIQIE